MIDETNTGDICTEDVARELEEESLEEGVLVSDGGEEGIHRDELHHLLNNYRRRALIRYMNEFTEENEFDLKAVSNEVTDLERQLNDSENSPSNKTVYTTISQHHIPVLEENRTVEFDRDSRKFRLGENFDIIRHYVDDGFYPEETPVSNLERDELHSILENSRRRAIVRYMKEFPEENHELQQISDEIASLEENISIEEITKEGHKRYRTSVGQNLSSLDDYGVINYDSKSHYFNRGENFSTVESYVEDSFYEPDPYITEEVALLENRNNSQGFIRGFFDNLRSHFD